MLFIERRLKALKNSSGLKAEKEFSLTFHQEGIPLLVSPLLLRKRDLGQVDLGRLIKKKELWSIEIGEVKSSVIGSHSMNRGQSQRLYHSQKFLSGIFGFPSRLIRLISEK